MKLSRRMLTFILTFVMLFSTAACQKTIHSTPELVPIVTSAPAVTEAPPEAQEPAVPQTTAAGSTASDAFHALDREVFIRYIQNDSFSSHQLLANPSDYGLTDADLNKTWGEFTEEDTEAYGRECAAYLERLLAITRSELDARDQLSYDILQQYLEDASAENIYAYYYEPLTEQSGLHTALVQALGLFTIRDEQDVLDYLALLEDVPRYLGQVLAYERKRAEMGLFMTEDALDAILTACKEITSARDSFYLIGTFNAAVDKLIGLDAGTAAGYKSRSEAAVKGSLMDAYLSLYDGLSSLRSSCRKPVGLCKVSDIGSAFFEYSLQREGDNRLSVEETLELLEAELARMFSAYQELYREHPEAYNDKTLSSGSVQTDLTLLESMTDNLLFTLPAHTLRISDVPVELQNQMSGAAYVIPPIDDWSDNEILINPAYPDSSRLLTLAHEGYPGHLFQYVYQRSLTDTGLMQRALHYGAYAEGWSQTAEYLIATTQQTYNSAYSELRFYENMMTGIILPAIISIRVNYYDYSEDSIRSYVSSWNISSETYAHSCYTMAVEQPFYIFNYATGYCQLAALMRDAEEDMGDAFDRKAFLKAYLDLGPGYFNLIQERMDVWIDENTPE